LKDYCQVERMGDGAISYYGIVVNGTDSAVADTALRISEDRLRLALEGAGAGFFDWAKSSGEIFCDGTAMDLCGITDSTVTIETWLHVMDRGCLGKCFVSLREIFSGTCIFFNIEFNLRANPGRWLSVSGKVIIADPATGSPLRVAGTVRDITANKQLIAERERINEILEERIRERTDQLERELETKLAVEQQLAANLQKERDLNNEKSLFVNMVSHEFRTPLAVIQGSVDLLDRYHKQLSSEERMGCLSDMRLAVRRMTQTMDDILILGKVQSNKLQFLPAAADILANCCGILGSIESLQEKRRIVLEIGENVPPKVTVDAGLMYHIASNLLSNALKYSPPGSPVFFSVYCRGCNLEITVEDFGIGIPEEDRMNVFRMFRRGSNVSNRKGIGVGMFVVKHCVNLHRGTIAILPKTGNGTIFQVTLPISRAKL
jgi:signal transduction histidine kinase